jgi:hypothetical protein
MEIDLCNELGEQRDDARRALELERAAHRGTAARLEEAERRAAHCAGVLRLEREAEEARCRALFARLEAPAD